MSISLIKSLFSSLNVSADLTSSFDKQSILGDHWIKKDDWYLVF